MSIPALRAMFVTASLAHGGAERHSITLMNRLAERRHECHLVHIKRAGTDQLGRIRVRDGGSVYCLDAVRYLDRGALARFADHIASTQPSVIIAANAYALMYATLALRLSRQSIPLVVTYHSMRLLDLKERLQMLAYRPFFWMADCAVFVCEKQRRHCSWRAVLSRRNEVIYNGVDTEEFRDRSMPEAREGLRRELGFHPGDYVIGISARLTPEKNILQMVDALSRLRARGIAARVLLVGDGSMREAIEARARSLQVERHVVITGFQQDVRPYIAVCDAMALCSHTEAFSLAAIESMAMGKPFVHSLVGGAAEMIRPGENGFLFPVGDTAALVDRLARLADPGVRGRMGRDARERVQALFSEAAMADRYEQLLVGLARTPPGLRAVAFP
ncbi:MAG TPA: glycosyltransferase family 4 protein [Burkholderiales bacterium]